MSLVDARLEAQKIAFGPLLFQAARLLRDLGILRALAWPVRADSDEIVRKVSLPLWRAGAARGRPRGGHGPPRRRALPADHHRRGHPLDELTRVNMDFVQHCCFQAMFTWRSRSGSGKPAGLRGLRRVGHDLPGPDAAAARGAEELVRFDHFYSDTAFPLALPRVFERRPRRLLDVGGNTGKWAIHCPSIPGCRGHDPRPPRPLERRSRTSPRAGAGAQLTMPIDLLDHLQPFPTASTSSG